MSHNDEPPTKPVISIKPMEITDPGIQKSPPPLESAEAQSDPDEPTVLRPMATTAPPSPDPLDENTQERVQTEKGVGQWRENSSLLTESTQKPTVDLPIIAENNQEDVSPSFNEESFPTLIAPKPLTGFETLSNETEKTNIKPRKDIVDSEPELPLLPASDNQSSQKISIPPSPQELSSAPPEKAEQEISNPFLSGHGDLVDSGPTKMPAIKPEPKKRRVPNKKPKLEAPQSEPSGASSVAMLGPPGVGKTYYCKGLVQLFLRPDRLGLHVKNLTAIVRRGERSLPLEGYLERLKTGSRESPTPPAHGLNLHELVVDWGKKDFKGNQSGVGRAAILLNDTAGEMFRNLDENAELQHYVSCSDTIWLLLPAWVLALCETEIRGQRRSYRSAVRDFTDEVDWMYDHPDRMTGQRSFTMVWTMGSDPVVRDWARKVKIYNAWIKSGKGLRDKLPFAIAHFIAFQRRLTHFLNQYIASIPELDLLNHGLSRLRKLGVVRHALINVIDDLEIEGKATPGGYEIQENLLHVEAPVLSLLSKTLPFGV